MTQTHALRRLWKTLALGVTAILLSTTAWAQTPEELLQDASGLANDSFYAESMELLDRVAADYPGTLHDAASRMQRARLLAIAHQDHQGARAVLETVVADFRETPFELTASLQVLDIRLLSRELSLDGYLSQVDNLILRAGGSGLSDLDPTQPFQPVNYLRPQDQAGILELLYVTAIGRILGQPSEVRSCKLDTAGALARFYRARFSDSREGATLLRNIASLQTGDTSLLNRPGDGTAPRVALVKSTIFPTETLAVSAHDGSLQESQIDLQSLKVEVDGQNVLARTTVRSLPGVAPSFERVAIETSPGGSWAVGAHSLKVVLQDLDGNETIRHLEFMVSSSKTLPAIRDALVYERSPHSNEGANPRLTLEKIDGKTARNLLAFDLSGINTNSLTSATLVLSIDPSDQVNGWGSGETVSVRPVTAAWREGDGKKYGLPSNQQTVGSGAGTTWFSPTDENISNDSPNSVMQWSGAASYVATGTSPPLTVRNHQTGELRFDVTQDVLNGASHGWLLRKDAESMGSKISFYSREGGGDTLGPRLILEYGGQTGMRENGLERLFEAVAGFFGLTTRKVVLEAVPVREGPKGIGQILRGGPQSAFLGEKVIMGFAGTHPLAQMGARIVYWTWLRGTPSLA